MLKRKCALLIDEDVSARQSLGAALVNKDFEVVSVCSGGDAVRELRARRFDAVLIDLNQGLGTLLQALSFLTSGTPQVESAKEEPRCLNSN